MSKPLIKMCKNTLNYKVLKEEEIYDLEQKFLAKYKK